MQYINKTGTLPTETDLFFKTNKGKGWLEMPQKKRKLLTQELESEQNGLCCYCCTTITDKPQVIEHLSPRSKFPKKIHDYQNLLLSCKQPKQCDNAKDNDIIAITPLEQRCDSIKLQPNGILYCDDGNKDDVESTIKTLKINNKAMINHRNEMVAMIENYAKSFVGCDSLYKLKEYKKDFLDIVKDFPNFYEIKYIVDKIT